MTAPKQSASNGPTLKKADAAGPPANWDRRGLPAWAYTNEELLDVEKNLLFRRHWQIAGHVSNVPRPGDYFCFDVAGERAVVVRGKDKKIRVLHNVCRHRGSRVVANETGSCGSALVCPFHGWSYNLDGTFRTTPSPKHLPTLDPKEYGLQPVEFEIWHGFIFVRFLAGPQPSVAKIMQRHEAEVSPYLSERAVPSGPFWTDSINANWKCVRDVDNEGYHVPMAHPGLQDLYGRNYFDEHWIDGTARSFASFDADDARLWSVRHYKAILPEIKHLPASHRRAWLYIGVFPNSVLYFYPQGIGFYQEFPDGTTSTTLRSAAYALPDSEFAEDQGNLMCRRIRAAQYLSGRINNETSVEDIQLTVWSNEAFHSSAYQGFILSDLEYGVRGHHDQLRALIPELDSEEPPVRGTLSQSKA